MTFKPNQVPIYYTLNIDQVDLVLEGLGELPLKRAGDFSNAVRAVALQALQAAEQQAMAEAQKADDAAKPTEVIDQKEPNDPSL